MDNFDCFTQLCATYCTYSMIKGFQDFEKKVSQHDGNPSIIKYALVFVVSVFVIGFIYLYIFGKTAHAPTDSSNQIFSEEEKLGILNSLAGDPKNMPAIEERREMLDAISKNKPTDAVEYSEEEKIQILNSLKR